MEDEIAEIVREYGWYAASISDHQPPFLYTIGLMQTLNHPELIMFGLDAENTHALFSQLIEDIRAGRSYSEPGIRTVDIASDAYQVGFRRVDETQHELYLGFAMGYCRHIGRPGELAAMQVFWPDSRGKFPFEPGCAWEVYQLQPLLNQRLTPRELKEWRRQWD